MPFLFPQPFRQRQPRQFFAGELAVGRDAEALEYRDQLPRVLRRMPGRAFEQHMHRRSAEEGVHFLRAGLVGKRAPPVLQPGDHRVAIARDLVAGSEGAVFGRYGRERCAVLDAIDHRLKERLADTEYVVAQKPDRTVAVVDDALADARGRNLAHVALRRVQYIDPLFDQFFGRQRRVAGAVQAYELGHVLEILSEDKLAAFRDDRHITHAQFEQLLTPLRVVQHIDGDEVDVFSRKKLFRPETAASPGLGEEDEFFGEGSHDSSM